LVLIWLKLERLKNRKFFKKRMDDGIIQALLDLTEEIRETNEILKQSLNDIIDELSGIRNEIANR
jgi:hypothetical protein